MAVPAILLVVLLMCDTFGPQVQTVDGADDPTTTSGVGGKLGDTTEKVANDVAVTETDVPLMLSSERTQVNGSEGPLEWTSSSPYHDVEQSTADNEYKSDQSLDYPEYVDDLWQYQRGLAILRYGLPVLLAFTTIDNVLAVVVLQHPTFRGSPTGFVLSALAVVDMLVVYTGLMRWWVVSMFDFDFRVMSENSCKFHVALTYFSRQLSAWTIVLLTIERFIAVRYPFQCRSICSLRRVVIAWCVIVVVLFGADCHFFATAGVITVVGRPVCYVFSEYVYFFVHQWYLIDACLSDLVPFVVIFVGNVTILTLIAIGRRRRAAVSRRHSIREDQPGSADRVTSMTLTLIFVSVVFITLNIPLDVFFIGFANAVHDSAELVARDKLFQAVILLLAYTSNSINFLLYFVSGRKFRLAALDIIRCHCFRKSQRPRHGQPVNQRSSTTTSTARTSLSSVISVLSVISVSPTGSQTTSPAVETTPGPVFFNTTSSEHKV